MLSNRSKLIFLCCLTIFTQQAFTQTLKGTLLVNTNFPPDSDSLILEVYNETIKTPLFSKPITPRSKSTFKINNPQPVWLMIFVKQNGKPKAAAGRLYMKGTEHVQVNLNGFFKEAEISGGENSFIETNRYLLFDVPSSIAKSKEFSAANLRREKSFQPRDGSLYIRMEEYKNNTLASIRKYNDYDYTLTSLWEKRSHFPLDFLDSSKTLFSSRVKSTKQWQQLDRYIKNELDIIKNKLNDSIVLVDPIGGKSQLYQLYSGHEFTFIDFWASWCVPCIREFPDLKLLYSKCDRERIGFVSLSIDKEKGDWEVSNSKQEFPWPTYLDVNEAVKDQFDITYIPQGVILDKNGKIIQRFVTKEQLVEFLKEKKILKDSTL